MRQEILSKILMIPAILIAFTFHEYSHAIVADKLGDKTPKFQGRLTLNPFAHIDIMGFLMILLVNFGWAKPVETNPSAFKHYYKDDLKVSVAGPIANLIVAFIFAILTAVFLKFLGNTSIDPTLIRIIATIMYLTVSINCTLFIFNLIPLPGLDGFHILRDLFPKKFYSVSDFLYKYQFIILLIFIFPITGSNSIASYVVGIPSRAILNLFLGIADKLFYL